MRLVSDPAPGQVPWLIPEPVSGLTGPGTCPGCVLGPFQDRPVICLGTCPGIVPGLAPELVPGPSRVMSRVVSRDSSRKLHRSFPGIRSGGTQCNHPEIVPGHVPGRVPRLSRNPTRGSRRSFSCGKQQ
jgi:hypothetical protein